MTVSGATFGRTMRKEQGHLAGYDPASTPRFQWEPELLEARRNRNEEVKRKSDQDRGLQKKESQKSGP